MSAIRHQQDRLGWIPQVDHVAVRIVHLIDRRRGPCRPSTAWSSGTRSTRASTASGRVLCIDHRTRAAACRSTVASGTSSAPTTSGTAARRSRSRCRTAEHVHERWIGRGAGHRIMEHVVRTVTIADPEISIRSHCDIGRPIIQARRAAWTGGTRSLLVNGRALRIAHGPNFFALQRALGDDAVLFVAEIQIFGVALFAEMHAVRAAPKHGAEGADELALVVEDYDAVWTLGLSLYTVWWM